MFNQQAPGAQLKLDSRCLYVRMKEVISLLNVVRIHTICILPVLTGLSLAGGAQD